MNRDLKIGKMAEEINIDEANTDFSNLLRRVMAGEEIVIVKDGVPVARLVPIDSERKTRTPGSAQGQFSIASDFDDPLPEFG